MVMHREKEKVKKITSETRFHSEMYSWKKGGEKKGKKWRYGDVRAESIPEVSEFQNC